MADIFVDDGGSNTSPYETWAKAATTMATAVSAASAGDRFIIGHNHAEAPGANTTYTFPGTAASRNQVISATSTAGGSTVIYNKADNIQIDLSGGNWDLIINGNGDFFGVSVKVGDDFNMIDLPSRITFDDSVIELSSANAVMRSGSAGGQNRLELKNTGVNFSGGGVNAGFQFAASEFDWKGGVLSWTGTQSTALFSTSDRNNHISGGGVDLSAISSALINVGDAAAMIVRLRHCLLNASVSLTTGTISDEGTQILMSGCDDTTGNDLYRLEYVDYWGSTVHNDSVYRDSGASDGTTNISWKMVSTANAAEFSEPTKSPPIYAWNDTTGSRTFTVSIVWDSASDLQDDEVWLELEYLEASADTDSAFADDRMADITATPADQTNNTETWTGTGGFGTVNKIEVAVTATVNRVGPIIARVCLAKPSTTIYVDPKVVVT